ncbi:E2 domain-associated cysteine-rich protein [Pseudomonas aeruginosa]
MRDWEEAERQYWDSMHGKPCCGSCDSCPLSP